MADDKKKLMALGALGVAILGVGAFQFTGGGSSEPAAPAKRADKAKEDAAKRVAEARKLEPKNPVVAHPLAQRDPFKGVNLPGPITVSAPAPIPAPTRTAAGRPTNVSGFVPPHQISGTDFGGGELPSPEVGPVKAAQDPEEVKPVAVAKPPEPQFEYKLSGVIVGRHPAVVLSDAQGNQRLVAEGAAVDGVSRVMQVERGKVLVRFRGKTIRLTVGGNTK